MKRQIRINPSGSIRFIHDDKLAGLLSAGDATVRRASHVEPVTIDGKVKWQADMSPVGGPVLDPCDTRTEALAKEVDWLNQHKIPVPA